MSSIGTLWGTPGHPRVLYPRAVAAYTGIVIDFPEGYVLAKENKNPEFLAKFPHGKIPAFEGKDGFLLVETVAIAQYFASLAPNSGLLGNDVKDAALIHQWVHLAEAEALDAVMMIWMMVSGYAPYNKPAHTTLSEKAIRALTTLDKHLSTRTFFVGERITNADIAVAWVAHRAVQVILDAQARPKFPHLIRHMETIVHQPRLIQVFGEPKYVEKALQYVPPPPAKEKKKEVKPASAPAATAPPPPVAAPKAEKKPKAKAEDDDDDEPLVPAEPKVKNPLDDLPKSTFNLEDWKRAYSNKDTRGSNGSLEWFYQNFDSEGFSIWRVDFKYNEELTLTFMSSNQIGGFYNRLEASRKYLFGSVGVLGESNNSVISGAFILRGQDVKVVVDVAPDWESYEYKKLDIADPADKSFFEAALAWDLELDGKKWVDGKNFK